MKSLQGKFITSAANLAQCPKFDLAEYALLGRSNVGKSSFINKIANNQKLAKTSNTPGKTRLINLFNFSDKFIIADLPGYGYAKVSKTEQASWQKNLEKYLLERENLKFAIQFIDARHEIQKNDFQMHDWLVLKGVAHFVVVTKCDYILRSKVAEKLREVERYFGCEVFGFSAKSGAGVDEVIERMVRG